MKNLSIMSLFIGFGSLAISSILHYMQTFHAYLSSYKFIEEQIII